MLKAAFKEKSIFYKSSIWCINTFVHANKLYTPKANEGINRMMNHFILSEKIDIRFMQSPYYEIVEMPSNLSLLCVNSEAVRFHFMIQAIGIDKTSNSSYPKNFIKTIEECVENKNEFIFFWQKIGSII